MRPKYPVGGISYESGLLHSEESTISDVDVSSMTDALFRHRIKIYKMQGLSDARICKLLPMSIDDYRSRFSEFSEIARDLGIGEVIESLHKNCIDGCSSSQKFLLGSLHDSFGDASVVSISDERASFSNSSVEYLESGDVYDMTSIGDVESSDGDVKAIEPVRLKLE